MVTLRTFGGLTIDGAPFPGGAAARRRPLALLAILAVAGPRGMSRDKLVAYLWPDSDDERARNSLSQALSAMRRELGVDQLVLGSTELRLNSDVITSDVSEFTRCVDDRDLTGALRRYTGPFLDGVYLKGVPEFEHWVEQERQRLHRIRLDVLEKLALESAQKGDHVSAVRWRRDRASAEPLESRAALELMRALVAAGDAAGALRHFHIHEAMVRGELGMEPDRTLATFAETLRSSGSEARPNGRVPPMAPAPTDAGTPPAQHVVRLRPASNVLMLAGAVLLTAMALVSLSRRSPTKRDVIGRITPVTRAQDALHFDPSISPDGRFVAYAAGVPGSMRIVVKAVNGSQSIVLTEGLSGNHRWPRWSPSGDTIAFQVASPQSTTGRLYLIAAFGGSPRLLTERAAWPAWSPDGKRIAFARGRLWVALSSGADAREVDSTGNTITPAWSPDGKRIVFVRDRAGYMGSNYGAAARTSIWIVDADGARRRQLLAEDHLHASPVWSPDGRAIWYVSDRDGARDVYRQRIGSDSLEGEPERMTIGANVYTFSLSRDGSVLAYGSLSLPSGSNVWYAPITDSVTPFSMARPVTAETQEIESFSVSHDGQWLAYDSNRDNDGRAHIFKVRLSQMSAHGQPIRLTHEAADDYSPRWSPDDSEIAFHRRRLDNRDVYVLSADGSREMQVTRDSLNPEYHPDWSPQGNSLVFASPRRGERGYGVFAVTRDETARWSSPQRISGFGYLARWSPTGNLVATAYDNLFVISARGGAPRQLVDAKSLGLRVRSIAWARDGKSILFQAADSNRVISFWKVDVATGRSRPVLFLNNGRAQTRHQYFDTDGRNLFFTISPAEADVFVAPLVRRR